jgi:phosphoglycolate phosphatase-like HAD superfamily hydrolase
MKLAVFDIDGTLTLGDGLGTHCFFSTFVEMFGDARMDRRLESYVESTDCAIAREAARRALGRDAGEQELEAFKNAYLERLQLEIAARARPYRPVAGAQEILPRIASMSGWHVAIATGNWRRAAALKLDCATIAAPGARACSEDGASRPEVLKAAIAAASAGAGGVERRLRGRPAVGSARSARAFGLVLGDRPRRARLASS